MSRNNDGEDVLANTDVAKRVGSLDNNNNNNTPIILKSAEIKNSFIMHNCMPLVCPLFLLILQRISKMVRSGNKYSLLQKY